MSPTLAEMVRRNAVKVLTDHDAPGHAIMCANDLLRLLEEIAALRTTIKTKDEQIAEMSALWQQIRKAEAA
jgi:hypothetical protein